ncbi:NGG1p interacting factor NIF3 [Acinetobacter larvae]|uniref:NGG1p interacting factor NIF3 n=1 Tax=Acinetobacter larvae TaxID=1789224 RepID=A0A1B2LXK4_9GAMM|nr:NGG1p interacting factor NIF3 [Acinetobacter larvae]AOA57671.1 NGG1p interacting factor NIF3 [Acinetobacter larvae]
MLKIIYFVPETHLEQTKQAIFAAGAGAMGAYSQCAWQVLGMGQFKPELGSQPYIGEQKKLQQVAEWRVESIVPEAAALAVLEALKASHPYEEPAFEFIQLFDINSLT